MINLLKLISFVGMILLLSPTVVQAIAAITCSSSPCIATSAMIKSRDSLATPEPNQPNTIDACADGTLGSYMSDESVENITITDMDSSVFRTGDTVKVEVWTWCYNVIDVRKIAYTNNSATPSWKIINASDCPSSGFVKFETSFELDDVPGTHTIRGAIHYYEEEVVVCGVFSGYNDQDDVSISVITRPQGATCQVCDIGNLSGGVLSLGSIPAAFVCGLLNILFCVPILFVIALFAVVGIYYWRKLKQ